MLKSPFYDRLRVLVARHGGLHNAHLHLDRINTLEDGYVDQGRVHVLESSAISLQKKHALINTVHDGPAYGRDDMLARVEDGVAVMLEANTRLADTMVDVTDDRVQLSALETLNEAAQAVADRITIRAAAYSPLGFRDDEPGRWSVFERGAKIADFIGCLPEADDRDDYPDNIGFEEHCVRMLDVARRENKMLHVHTDQRVEPTERGTERLLEVMHGEPGPVSQDGTPMVWAVHMISPTTYDDARFARLVDNLLACNVGVISCPSAAVGMRQIRPLHTPADNSIPRILQLAAAGIPIRLGSDNVADICSPSTTADLMDEVFVLSAAIRFYQPEILAKFAAGVALSEDDRALIADHLRRNDVEIEKVLRATGQTV
ncbi:hypothetical protein PSQ19_13665 [Devosia algicola]|uniref:Amidohydrolase-related domain-containing protein n=1 Tax=Devosia algicola TaxID=3026418 RepID=A0ABY7YKQ1_9HYPH|nr:hypothetical protein [Devosia algicola]WDR01774.1 hypothetical protein PSQ19_13665 [Devosia algicola]